MNLANLINLTNVEMGLILVEMSVLCLIYLCLGNRHFKRMSPQPVDEKPPLWDSSDLKKWVQESQVICHELSNNLKEKREIAQRLIDQLDGKIVILESMLEKVDEKGVRLSGGGIRENPAAQILEMAEAGVEVPDIARQLQISKGEVQLTLDLKKYCQ